MLMTILSSFGTSHGVLVGELLRAALHARSWRSVLAVARAWPVLLAVDDLAGARARSAPCGRLRGT